MKAGIVLHKQMDTIKGKGKNRVLADGRVDHGFLYDFMVWDARTCR